MDRNGKKAKATNRSPRSERSDLKAKARGALDQINQGARTGAAARDAKAHLAPARTERRSG